MATYLHERHDGRLVEYRRHPYDPGVLHLEGRVLRRDGTPYDGRWFRAEAEELLGLQLAGSDIVDVLSREGVD